MLLNTLQIFVRSICYVVITWYLFSDPPEQDYFQPQPEAEDERVVVPPLPGPLDPIGQEVDDAIENLLDPPTVPTEPGDVDEIVEDLTDTLEDATEPVAEATEPVAEPTEPTGDATDLLDPLG